MPLISRSLRLSGLEYHIPTCQLLVIRSGGGTELLPRRMRCSFRGQADGGSRKQGDPIRGESKKKQLVD